MYEPTADQRREGKRTAARIYNLVNQGGVVPYPRTPQGLNGKMVPIITRIVPECGPRNLKLKMTLGQLVGAELEKKLRGGQAAPLCTWKGYRGNPLVYQGGGYLFIDYPWGPYAQTMFPLAEADWGTARSTGETMQWLAGVGSGGNVALEIGESAPHYLAAGATRSGKTTALYVLMAQVSLQGAKIVVIDGKGGADLGVTGNLRGVVGPVATSENDALAALQWVEAQRAEREREAAQGKDEFERLVVMIDEYTTFSTNAAFVAMVESLTRLGASSRISVVIAMQRPAQNIFGDTPRAEAIRGNCRGRLVFHMEADMAGKLFSKELKMNASSLEGQGDGLIGRDSDAQRVQGFYLSKEEMLGFPRGRHEIEEWGEFEGDRVVDPESYEPFTPRQHAVSLMCAAQKPRQAGRPTLQKKLEEVGEDENATQRLRDLLAFGRDEYTALQELGADICTEEGDDETERE